MVKLFMGKNHIEIQVSRGDLANIEKCSSIPYVHKNRTNTVYKTTMRNLPLVLELFRGITVDNIHEAPLEVQQRFFTELDKVEKTKNLKTYGPKEDGDWLFKHQQLGRELSKIQNRYGFFYDTRTGKTPMSLQIMYDDIKQNPDHKWLVLCPLILIDNAWVPDAKEFFPDLKVQSLHAPTKAKRLKLFEQDANVYVQNVESFVTYLDEIRKLGIHGVVVDESSVMKSTKSKFAKAAVEFSHEVERWYLLSGTPAPNGIWEYYRQLQSIDFYGVHQSYTQFKQYFFNDIGYGQFEKLVVKPERKQELEDLISNYAIYVDKEDVLKTAGRDFIDYEVTMPDNIKSLYATMAKELYVEFENGSDTDTIVASSAAAKLNKLRQISSGFIIDTELQETRMIDMYKFNALLELLRSFGNEQAIVWCNYKEEFKVLKRLLGDNCGLVYGEVDIHGKNKAIQDFKDGKTQFLIANPASADKGLTLTNAHICVYFSLTYSYELYKQSMERIYGGIHKQPKRCKYYLMQVKGSVDKAMLNALKDKKSSSMAMLDCIRNCKDYI